MVGYTLRQERERQNLTVEDIEQGTSIRALYIEAIEAGEYDKLPGAVYTKGFIKNYAKFLNMDADAAAKEFANDMAELKAEADAEAAKVAAAAQNPEQQTEVKPTDSEKISSDRKPLGHSIQFESNGFSSKLVVAAVVFIAAIAGVIWSFMSDSDGEVAKVNPPVQTAQPAPTEQPAANTPTTPVASAAPPPPSDTVSVQARFNSRCWALVTVDGAVVEEGIIEGGQTLSWEGKDNISFRLGNAGAVEFFQNGKSLGVTGAEGDVVDKVFTRN